jgi:hypothetical protein
LNMTMAKSTTAAPPVACSQHQHPVTEKRGTRPTGSVMGVRKMTAVAA